MRRHVFAFSFACMAAASSSISFAQPPEFGPPGSPEGPMGGMMQNSPLMVALDVDGDGQLSKKEVSKSAAALNALDKNNDGVVSMDELRPEFGGPRNGPGGEEPGGRGRRSGEAGRNGSSASNTVSKLMAMDKDKDGKVAKSEVDGRLTALFEKADADKDGFATKEEIEKLARASDENDSRRGGGLGQGGPGPGRPGGFGGGPGGTGMPPGGFGPGGGPGGFGPPNPDEFVDRAFEFDVDGDGKLSKEELSKMFQGNAPGGPGIRGERGGRQRNR